MDPAVRRTSSARTSSRTARQPASSLRRLHAWTAPSLRPATGGGPPGRADRNSKLIGIGLASFPKWWEPRRSRHRRAVFDSAELRIHPPARRSSSWCQSQGQGHEPPSPDRREELRILTRSGREGDATAPCGSAASGRPVGGAAAMASAGSRRPKIAAHCRAARTWVGAGRVHRGTDPARPSGHRLRRLHQPARRREAAGRSLRPPSGYPSALRRRRGGRWRIGTGRCYLTAGGRLR